ncbi:MAG TPA: PLD nuclease N-terminal domain-containing protein [Micromonosporaceae bacterium]
MGRVVVLLLFAMLALLVVALIDCLSVERERIRVLPRPAWAVLIVILPGLGAIAWFVSGRTHRSARRLAVSRAAARRPAAPEDDPEFLRRLNTPGRLDDEEQLRLWEEELRRRDDE